VDAGADKTAAPAPLIPVVDPLQAPAPAVKALATSFKALAVPVGGTLKVPVALTAKAGTATGKAKVTWKSSTPKVATVTKGKKSGTLAWPSGGTGKLPVRAVKAGTAKITLTAAGAPKLVLTIKVVPKSKAVAASKVTLATKAKTLATGKSLTVKARVTPKTATQAVATWRSTQPKVAQVDAAGKVTGLAKGKTVIVGKIAGKTVKLRLTIT
jgi:uncharacterized protein YjdB